MRESGLWAKDKLRILEAYMDAFSTAMRNKNWCAFHYVDIMAGSGKNRIRETGEILLGSPLIALDQPIFTKYFFCEADSETFEALERRVAAHPRGAMAKLYNADSNAVIAEICSQINEVDRNHGKTWGSLNLAFIDPEGPEDVHWSTVARLAEVNRMDMIINVPTNGINRLFGRNTFEHVDAFFGTDEWRQDIRKEDDAAIKRRHWLDLYKRRLRPYGYTVESTEDVTALREFIARNSRDAQLYTLTFASKHPLGDELWAGVLRYLGQRPLF
ncbi:MAG: hypothetical protein CUN51_00515 [Candidatus Thermofonsia Clade 1 bacterium]|uniref:Three-Cys-motif partner protein TcmP n=1 Tax=Candidatus Thermofonsia Clade 1 bacterium TaxID=2364210 RepID=A0A2M8P3L9_9CHLR|nr:MAG: hypothetical protein CUN51_00515 [Candidatus Thermofonsia Clade 1 bacterium]